MEEEWEAAGKSSSARVNVRWTGVRFGSEFSRSDTEVEWIVDPACFPLLELAQRYDIPVFFHTGLGGLNPQEGFAPKFRISLSDPVQLEDVAVRRNQNPHRALDWDIALDLGDMSGEQGMPKAIGRALCEVCERKTAIFRPSKAALLSILIIVVSILRGFFGSPRSRSRVRAECRRLRFKACAF